LATAWTESVIISGEKWSGTGHLTHRASSVWTDVDLNVGKKTRILVSDGLEQR
jgi:hypothetical protein